MTARSHEAASGGGSRYIDDDRERGVFRVDRATMTSPEVFELEQRQIFDECWLYIGHDSEIAKPGDYVRRTVVGRPLFLVRGIDGTVRCFYNTCPHRGAEVCREERGTAKRFTCFYHAWTFDTSGSLLTMPDEEGYGEGFKETCSLTTVPKLDSYRGFWFISFNDRAEPLHDYLDGAKEYLDLVVDQAEEGMRVLPGTNEYAVRANWKLMVENSLDGYHGLPLHQTYFAYVKSLGGGISGTNLVGEGGKELGHGHVVLEGEAPYGRPIARWDNLFGEDSQDEIAAIRARLVDAYGEDRAKRMADNFRNLIIFPNLMINDITAITIRYVEPLAADLMRVRAWALAPCEESGPRLQRRIDSYLTFIGPGGFATPDDVEALESCQAGFGAHPNVQWSDISRGMTRMPTVTDEVQVRAYWRAWAARMDGRPIPPPVEWPETPNPAHR